VFLTVCFSLGERNVDVRMFTFHSTRWSWSAVYANSLMCRMPRELNLVAESAYVGCHDTEGVEYEFSDHLIILQGNESYTGTAARDTANALRVLASAVRGVAATSNDRNLQDSIVDHARDVMDKSANLMEEAKKAVQNPANPDNQTRLAQV
jgi:hypothetical protein